MELETIENNRNWKMEQKRKMKKQKEKTLRVSLPSFLPSGRSSGFTVVELLVSLGIFVVVVSIAVGGFVRALHTQDQAQALISANSNASLAIEIMARDMRTGTQFCAFANSLPDTYTACGRPQQSANGYYYNVGKLAFFDASRNQVVYCLAGGAIRKSLGSAVCDETSDAITSNNVNIRSLAFEIFGNQANDGYPPRITIVLAVSPSSTDPALNSSVINLQTTVSSRQPSS